MTRLSDMVAPSALWSAVRAGDAESLAWVAIALAVVLLLTAQLVRALDSGGGRRRWRRTGDGERAEQRAKGRAAADAGGASSSSSSSSAGAAGAVSLPPTYAEGVPLVGNALSFARGPLQFAQRGYDALGECFTIRVGPKRLTFVAGPEAHAVFFRATDEELDQREVYSFSVPVFGEGVVYDAPLPVRLEQFRFVSTALRPDRLREYVPLMVHEAERYFARHWAGDSGEADLLHAFSELIILTASRCLMGREVREHMFEAVSKLYHDLDQGMQPLSVFAPRLPTPAHRRRDAARRGMKRLFHGIIAERRARYEAAAAGARAQGRADGAADADARAEAAVEAVKEKDVLQVFMDARYKDGSRLTEDVMTGLLIAVLFAGQHTSTITSSWTGLLMLRDRELVQRVREEQQRVLYDNGGSGGGGDENKEGNGGEEGTTTTTTTTGASFSIDYDKLLQLDLLHRCIKEALRMYPPLIFIMRAVKKERRYKHYRIPAGDTLVLSPPLSMRLPQVFAEPHRYDPDRYAPPREEDKRAAFSHVGFGGGRHACMGEQFAYLQIKTIWSVLLRDFDMEPAGALPEPDYDAMVVGPKPPCRIRWRRRRRQAAEAAAR